VKTTIVISVVLGLVAASHGGGTVPAIAGGYFGEPELRSSADWDAFAIGLRQFSHIWQEADGVGPTFNGRSCMACHAVPMPGGAGLTADTFVLISPQVRDDQDGLVFQRLQRISGAVTERAIGPDPVQRRKAPMLFGLGLLESVPAEKLMTTRSGPDHISGRPGGAEGRFGRFGWKARVSDLEQFVRVAFAVELGFGPRALHVSADSRLETAIGQVADFVRMLGPPPKRGPSTPLELTGQALFAQIGCAQCHVPTHSARHVQGGVVTEEEIHPYTDLLLHDMGAALADGIKDGNAHGSDFRTPPLWGVASSGPPYLHDGRANDLTQAIAAHDGEASDTRLRWESLTNEERRTLLLFLQAL
jgi:CxxC motif-containing protein (DUF1111 family)